MPVSVQEVTGLLVAWGQGDQGALDRLMPVVHQELRRIARRHMAGERSDHTLQTTALVNEAYLRLVSSQKVRGQDRAHLFAISATLMRRILVDHARKRNYQKRGAGERPVVLLDHLDAAPQKSADLVALDEALAALALVDPRKCKVVEMKFFGGLSVEEIAEVLKVSQQTVLRDWRLARIWLWRELDKCEHDG
jgi:RNA polymerase sigma-70 factor (ECF subfamily)